VARRDHIRGKGEFCAERLSGMCTPKVNWLQDLSGENRVRSRGLGAIEAASRQSIRLQNKANTVNMLPQR